MSVPTAGGLLAALAIITAIGGADLERALSIGRRPEAERARFHAVYVVDVNAGDNLATVEQIELLTEFRRAVIAVEERAKLGDYMFGLAQLEAAVRPYHNQVSVRARLRFNPMNALPAVPEYELRVGSRDDRLLALAPTTRSPVFVQNQEGGSALMGVILDLVFDSGIIGQHRYPVSVVLGGKTIASTPIDFGRNE